MNIENEKVEHIKFGVGIITEVKESRIWVRFQEPIGTKEFVYPEVFEKFLKAVYPEVENNVLEDLHKRQEQIRLELEEKEKAREAARQEEKRARLELVKKKPAKSIKKKS